MELMAQNGIRKRNLAYTGPLRITDWNFSQLPDEEVIACCLWEYARESPSIGMAAEFAIIRNHTLAIRNVKSTAEDEAAVVEHQRRVQAQAKQAGFDYEKFLGRFWACDLGFIWFYDLLREFSGPSARPWQSLPKRGRRYLVKQLADTSIFEPLRPANAGELEQLWEANNTELRDIRMSVRGPNDDSEDMELLSPTKPLPIPPEKNHLPERQVTVAFTVDFSRFTDTEMEAIFRTWLKQNRLKRWRKPQNIFPSSARRGQKANDYKVALERLGLMRLLHWNTPGKIKTDMPDAWTLYGRKEKVFRREIRAAIEFFHERFPFLSKKEKPSSCERYMTWMRPMQKICDRIDAEWGIK